VTKNKNKKTGDEKRGRVGRGGDLAKWLCRSELHQKKRSKYLVEPFPHFGPHFFFSLKFFLVFCMVVVVVVAIHLGGGSWDLNSSQPLVFFFF